MNQENKPKQWKAIFEAISQRWRGLARVILESVVIAIIVGIVIHLQVIPWFAGSIFHSPTPRIETTITEYLVTPGGWYEQVYWREGYRVYNITIENSGNAPADKVRINLMVSGGVFAVQATPHVGLLLDAPYAVVQTGDDTEVVDPVYLGSILDQYLLGATFDVIRGDPQVSVSLAYFAYNSSWNMFVYFKTETGMLEGKEVVCYTEWFFGGKQVTYWTSEVFKQSYSCFFNPWPYNPYIYTESGDVNTPYAHVDIDRYNLPAPGFQNQTLAVPDEMLKLEIVFNYTNVANFYATMAINVFVEWHENDTIGNMYQGIKGTAGYLETTFLLRAPVEPGRYGVRVLVSEYGYAESYSSWNVKTRGFQLWIDVLS